MSDLANALLELKNKEVLWHQRPQAVLSIKGKEAIDFLQRMSTNDLTLKLPVATSFINAKGRMVDYVVVYAQEDRLLLLSSLKDPKLLYDWLEKFHFIEDFTIESEPDFLCFYLLGAPKNDQHFSTAFSLPTGESWSISIAKDPPFGQEISQEIFETLRIASLMPLAPNEINDSHMPQNINLLSSIAEKGCYIGQEVILKALTYQKNVKTLQGQKLSQETWLNEDLSPYSSIAPIFHEGLVNALAIKSSKDK